MLRQVGRIREEGLSRGRHHCPHHAAGPAIADREKENLEDPDFFSPGVRESADNRCERVRVKRSERQQRQHEFLRQPELQDAYHSVSWLKGGQETVAPFLENQIWKKRGELRCDDTAVWLPARKDGVH